MLSPISPRLTVFVSGTGAALSKLQILTQPSSFACIFSALHLTLDFDTSAFFKYFVKGAIPTQPKFAASFLPCGPLFSRSLVLQITLGGTSTPH